MHTFASYSPCYGTAAFPHTELLSSAEAGGGHSRLPARAAGATRALPPAPSLLPVTTATQGSPASGICLDGEPRFPLRKHSPLQIRC